MEIHQFECLSDNYGYLLHDSESGVTACVDTPDLDAIERALAHKGWSLTHIFNTHHHPDHVGANLALKARYGCQIIGPLREAERIPGLDIEVSEGDVVSVGGARATVHDMPGHTLGHIVYHFQQLKVAFVGDVIFPMGCGRLFEGTSSQAWRSLQSIAGWPKETWLYCAHEYTQANGRFALSVEPGNQALQQRCSAVAEARIRGEFTVPSQVGLELETNPFLRGHSAEIKSRLSLQDADSKSIFAALRQRKDRF